MTSQKNQKPKIIPLESIVERITDFETIKSLARGVMLSQEKRIRLEAAKSLTDYFPEMGFIKCYLHEGHIFLESKDNNGSAIFYHVCEAPEVYFQGKVDYSQIPCRYDLG